MIYLLDDNGKEFAIGASDISHLLGDSKFVALDENGVFEYNYMNNLKRHYVSFIDIHGRLYNDVISQGFRIVGYDYKGKYHEVTAPKQITTSDILYIL